MNLRTSYYCTVLEQHENENIRWWPVEIGYPPLFSLRTIDLNKIKRNSMTFVGCSETSVILWRLFLKDRHISKSTMFSFFLSRYSFLLFCHEGECVGGRDSRERLCDHHCYYPLFAIFVCIHDRPYGLLYQIKQSIYLSICTVILL